MVTEPVRYSRTRHRVSMVDVDMVQIHFGTYFRWMDQAYLQLLDDLGHPLSVLMAHNLATPTVDARCNYRRPIHVDDVVDARTWISSVGRASYYVTHEFHHANGVVAVGVVKHVWTTIRPMAALEVPPWIRAAGPPPLVEGARH